MCQPVVTPLTFHDISNSDCRWGVAGAALKFEVVRVFSALDIATPGDDLRAERFNSTIVADKFSRLSVVRRANGTTFFAEICSPFEPSEVFYFGDASSSKKTKTFFTRMSSTCCCCRVSAGDAFADWDTAKQTSWTLRRLPRSLNFHAVLPNRSEKEGKTSANSIIIIIMLSSSCFMFLQCIRKICAFYGWRRWQSVTLVYSSHGFCCRCCAIGTAADLLPTRHRRVHCRRCHVNCNHIYPSLHVDAACSCFRTESQW